MRERKITGRVTEARGGDRQRVWRTDGLREERKEEKACGVQILELEVKGWAGLGWLVRAFSAAWEGVRNVMELSQPEEEVEVLGDTTKSTKSKQT